MTPACKSSQQGIIFDIELSWLRKQYNFDMTRQANLMGDVMIYAS
jgi:hypothetical protein